MPEKLKADLGRPVSVAYAAAGVPVLQFDQVTVCARGKTLFSELSFALYTGEKIALSGHSGSGKSSILKTIVGIYPLHRGAVYFQGKLLNPSVVKTLRCCTAYIGQEPLLAAETVRDALLLPFQFNSHRGQTPAETQLVDVLQRLHLSGDILKQECSRISGGEKQRLAIARGLLLGKNVYLLDEVTSALDAASKKGVFDVFSDPDLTVLSVAHDPEWLERCDKVLELEAGRIIKHSTGTPQGL